MKTLSLILLLVAGAASAQSIPTEILLLPLDAGSTPGAHGSQWVVEWTRHVTGSARVGYFVPNCGLLNCRFFFEPGTALIRGPFFSIVAIEQEGAEDLTYSILVRDTSRAAENWGTTLNAVREREFATEVINLLNIPGDTRYRRALRLWTFPDEVFAAMTLHVRIFDMTAELAGAPVVLAERSISIPATTHTSVMSGRHLITDFDGMFPEAVGAERLRIEVRRTEGAGRFWGFASITNNETQLITTFVP